MKTLLFITAILITGTVNAQYLQTTEDVHGLCPVGLFFPDKATCPGLTKKNDVKLNFSVKIGVNDNENGLIGPGKPVLNPLAEIAYSPIEHIYATASYRSLRNREIHEENMVQSDRIASVTGSYVSNYDFNGRYDGNQGEIGAGFYLQPTTKSIVDICIGYGFGNIERSGGNVTIQDYDTYGGSYNTRIYSLNFYTRFNNYFIQATYGYMSEHAAFKFGVKGSFRDVTQMNYKTTETEEFVKTNYNSSNVVNNDYGFIQPFADIEAGGRVVRYNFQAGISDQLFDWSFAGNLKGYVCMGVSLNLVPGKKS